MFLLSIFIGTYLLALGPGGFNHLASLIFGAGAVILYLGGRPWKRKI